MPHMLNITTSVGGIDSLVGQTVSLNTKQGINFAVGDINLTTERYWAIVSSDMPQEYYGILNKGIAQGYLAKGKHYIPAIDKPEGVIDEYWGMIRSHGKSPEVMDMLRELTQKKMDRNHTIGEIATELIEREKAYRRRQDVLNILADLMEYHQGDIDLSPVVDHDAEGKTDDIIFPPEVEYQPKPRPTTEGNETSVTI